MGANMTLKQHDSKWALLAAFALASAGCSLIKVNGKSLGGSSGDGAGESSGGSIVDQDYQRPDPRTEMGKRGEGFDAAKVKTAMCKHSMGGASGTVAELEKELATKDKEYAAEALVEAMCAEQSELAEDRAGVKKVGQKWMKKHHLDERDLQAIYLKVRGRGDSLQDLRKFSGPVGEYGELIRVTAGPTALDWIAEPSMLARVAVVRACFSLGNDVYRADTEYPLLMSVLCTREPIDLAKAEAEIDATEGLNDLMRYELRGVAWRASEAVRQAKPAVEAIGKEDPGVGQLIAIADKERKAWSSASAQRVKLRGQLFAMEAAAASNKRSAFAGCEDKTIGTWSELLGAMKLPEVADKRQTTTYLATALSTAEGYLAYQALRLCSEVSESPQTALRGKVVSQAWVRRGPYTSTVASWLAAEKIEFDDRSRTMGTLASGLLSYEQLAHEDLNAGVIAKISEVEGGVEVTFKTVREPQPKCQNWRETNRIVGINSSGRFVFQEVCTKMGMSMIDITPDPVRFGKILARGLKPGMFLAAMQGLPVVATRSPGSEAPIFVLGALLK